MKLSKREEDPIFQKKGSSSMEKMLILNAIQNTIFKADHSFTAESGNWDIP